MSNSIKDRNIIKILISHAFFQMGRRMFIIFMSIYIWDLTQSFTSIALFNITFLLSHTITFTIFGYPVKKGYANSIKFMGLIGYIFLYGLLFVLRDQAVYYLIPLGISLGCTNGMYFIAYHVQNYDITNNANRGNYAGMEKSMKTMISLFLPIIGGWIIISYGYPILFLVGGLLQIITISTGWIKYPHKKTHPLHLRTSWQVIKNHKDIMRTLWSGFYANLGHVRSLQDILLIYLFIALGSELEVGSWVSLFTVLSVFTVYYVGKYVSYDKYKKIAFTCGTMLSASILSITLLPSLSMFIFFGAIKSMVQPLIGIARRVYALNNLNAIKNHHTHRTEFIIIREWIYIGFGGILSFVPFFFLDSLNSTSLKILLIGMSIATFLGPWQIWKITSKLQ